MRKIIFGLVCALTVVAITAAKCSCSMGGGIDPHKVETLILDSFKGQGVTSAKCPESVEATKGTTF